MRNCTAYSAFRSSLPTKLWASICYGILFLQFGAVQSVRAEGQVKLMRTPDNGIQPQAIVDSQGTFHLIYFKGDPGAGDIFYARRAPGKKTFSDPIQVNSNPGSAIAVGTIRGGQIALGKGGRVHVAWNGSGRVKENSGMFCARSNDEGTAFEPQRNLMKGTEILDGGGTVAADGQGNVYVAWHALKKGSSPGEDNRRMWVARSVDEGKTFADEAPAWLEPTGACGCCSSHAFADSKGSIYVLYRSANQGVNRDMYLLSSKDTGKNFQGSLIHKWKIPG